MDTPKKAPTASNDGDQPGLVLLANGSSGPWDVAVDEGTGEPEKLFAHIEGPSLYLYFEIPSRGTIETVLCFLEKRPAGSGSRSKEGGCKQAGPVRIGNLGRASLNLLWDEEHADRCFLLLGGSGKSSLQLTFSGEEIKHLTEALRQVKSDLEEEEQRVPAQG